MAKSYSELFAEEIIIALKKEFEDKHLTGQLVKTAYIMNGKDETYVHIPAEIYNFYRYFKDGVIIPRGGGSYASKLDKSGSSFPIYDKKGKRLFFFNGHNHKGFLENIIREATLSFKKNNKLKLSDKEGDYNGEQQQ